MRRAKGDPEAHDAERSVIGAILISPAQCIPICQGSIGREFFASHQNQIIYDAILDLFRNKTEIDTVTLCQKLKDAGLLKAAGDYIYVTKCFMFTPSAANLENYLTIVKEKHSLRITLAGLEEIAGIASCEQSRVGEIPGMLRNLAGKAAEAKETRINANLTEIALRDLSERIDRKQDGTEKILTSGLQLWDDVLHGIFPRRFYVIGSRPKIGKSALIEQMADTQAGLQIPVAIFQRDMSVQDMVGRIACRRSGVVFEDFISGRCSEDELIEIKMQIEEIDPRYLRIHSPHNLTADELASIVEREVNEFGVQVFYLDLFQRLKTKEHERVEGLTDAANIIRDVIQNTGVSGIVLAEILKDADTTKRPHSGQFKYCDGLFSSCDTSIMLWSDDDPKKLFDKEKQTYRRQEVTFTVDANRGGGVSDNTLYFDRPHMTFHSNP